MNKFARSVLYVLTIAAVLLTSVMGTTTVYAEDGTGADPPPEDPAITETTDLPAQEQVEAPATEPAADPPVEDPGEAAPVEPAAESPVEDADPIEAAPEEPAAESAEEDADPVDAAPEEPAAEFSGENVDPVEGPPEQDAPTEEAASLPEIMEMVPEGTDLLVLNDEGTAEPLASQEASEILIKGDPTWCPVGQAPGDAGCSGSHTSFNGLFIDLRDNSYAGDGVIWVEANYDRTQDTGTIEFDHTNGDLAQLDDLTIRGGWDGANGSTTTDPNNPSVLDDALVFSNWIGAISIYNLEFDEADDARGSLNVETDGDISLTNITINDNAIGPGASLDNCLISGSCSASGGITVTESDFTNNAQTGLILNSDGPISVTNVTADDNLEGGILVTGHETPDMDAIIKDTTASNNVETGIEVWDIGGDLKLKNVTASNNSEEGIWLVFIDGDINGHNITANQNTEDGIEIDNTRGSVYLSEITANETSAGDGVDIHGTDGNVKLKSVTATHNNQAGIEVVNVDGSLFLQCVHTSDNDGDGIYIEVDHGFTIKCSRSADNGGDGLQIVDAPTALLKSFISRNNTGLDINYDPNVTTVTEKEIDCDPTIDKPKPKHKPKDQPFTKLYCLPGEIKAALYDTYGDQIEFTNLCGYEAGVYDPNSWLYPETIPGGGDDYITSLQDKMLEEIPTLEPVTDFGIPGILAQVLDELPFMLPDGYFYASGFFTAVIDEGEYLDPLPEESELTVRFRVPEWLDPGEELTILWWDGADWVDLGGEYSEDGLYFQITTVETGVFVLSTFEAES